jgi:hypothetical protein
MALILLHILLRCLDSNIVLNFNFQEKVLLFSYFNILLLLLFTGVNFTARSAEVLDLAPANLGTVELR